MSKRKATDAAHEEEEDKLVQTHCSHIGSRPSQEDRLTIVDNGWSAAPDGTLAGSDSAGWPRCRFYAVFDGHLGEAVAEKASVMLWSHLQPALIALQRRAASGGDAGGDGAAEGDAPADASAAVAPPSVDAGAAATPSAEALTAAMREAFRATEAQLLEQVRVRVRVRLRLRVRVRARARFRARVRARVANPNPHPNPSRPRSRAAPRRSACCCWAISWSSGTSATRAPSCAMQSARCA